MKPNWLNWAHWLLGLAALASCAALQAQSPEKGRGAVIAKQEVVATRKVALVIGNDRYRVQPLDNPARDAEAMGKVLRELGFETQVLTNADRLATVRALQAFTQRLHSAAVGLFFFAGHGVQMAGTNYLIPTDADLGSEDQVKYNTLRLDDVLATLDQAGVKARIVILDACRNNPFERGRGGAGGLAAVTIAPEGTLISYATSPGRVALDGAPGGNGLFTTHLLQALQTPGLPIEQVFKLTRGKVIEASRGRQVPWESTSLTGSAPLVLRTGPTPPSAGALVAAAEPAAAGKSAARGMRATGDRFRECPRCPEMVVLPAGQFRMGSAPDETGRRQMEGPPVSVRIERPLAVGRFEVTFNEWEACVIDGGCDHWPDDRGWGRDRRPVVGVSWEDAQRYITWLNRHTRRAAKPGEAPVPQQPQYRLLTEAEWEYAARAGSQTARPWGADLKPGLAQCSDCGNAQAATVAAGSFAANGWGLHDMLGNAWEWVEDCRNDSLTGQPADGRARVEGDCAQRGVRGGGWSTGAKGVRTATRSFYPVSRRDATVGFRVALSLGN